MPSCFSRHFQENQHRSIRENFNRVHQLSYKFLFETENLKRKSNEERNLALLENCIPPFFRKTFHELLALRIFLVEQIYGKVSSASSFIKYLKLPCLTKTSQTLLKFNSRVLKVPNWGETFKKNYSSTAFDLKYFLTAGASNCGSTLLGFSKPKQQLNSTAAMQVMIAPKGM